MTKELKSFIQKDNIDQLVQENSSIIDLLSHVSGESIADFKKTFVHEEFKESLKHNNPDRLHNALNAFARVPLEMQIADHQKVMLSSSYEALYFSQKWQMMAEISDKLLSLKNYIKWKDHKASQYPLTYLVAGAISLRDKGDAYIDQHVKPWLSDGLAEPRLAF